MSPLTLDEVERFHAELLNIRSAGIELHIASEVGCPFEVDTSTVESLRGSLARIETGLASELGRGNTLEACLDSQTAVPSEYAAALRIWQETKSGLASFVPLVAATDETQRSKTAIQIALVQPWVWICFGLVTYACISLLTTPHMLRLVRNMRIEPGPVLKTVLFLRELTPAWLGLVFILCAAAATYWLVNRGKRKSLQRRSGFPGCSEIIRRSNFARRMAEKVASIRRSDKATSIVQKEVSREFPQSQVPPVLQWATTLPTRGDQSSESATGSDACRRLRLAEQIYGGIAATAERQQCESAHTSLGAVLVGGFLVLCLALCVFGPVVELLYLLAAAHQG